MDVLRTFKSGTELLESLRRGELSAPDAYVGMVKPSPRENSVAFAATSCDEWVDIPAELIDDAEVLRYVPCGDHSHPLVRLKLKFDESDPIHAMVQQLLSAVKAPGWTFASTGFGTFASGALRAAFGAIVPGRSPADPQRGDAGWSTAECLEYCNQEMSRQLGYCGWEDRYCECQAMNSWRF